MARPLKAPEQRRNRTKPIVEWVVLPFEFDPVLPEYDDDWQIPQRMWDAWRMDPATTQYSLADIATGCALGFLDLRRPELPWRDDHPNLVRLTEKLAKRPSFAETAPPTA